MTSHPARWDAIFGGIVFALVCAGWFAEKHGVISLAGNFRIILPVALIVAGLAGIIATVRVTQGEGHE